MENNNDRIQKTNWAILCPGPSLTKWPGRIIEEDDRVICVNGAAKIIIPDYWVMVDEEVFNDTVRTMGITHLRVLRRTTILWVPEKWNQRAAQGLVSSLFYDFKKETWTDLTREMNAFLDHDLEHLVAVNGYPLSWNNTSMFQAIALAIKKGTKHIQIYGADLKGEGYFAPGLENSRTVHTDARWAVEKFWFEKIVEACARHGIFIDRMVP